MATERDPHGLKQLFVVGWTRSAGASVTLVSNHESGKFVWAAKGKMLPPSTASSEFGSEASAAITAMSMDMSPSVTWLHRLCDLRYRPRRLVEDWSSSFTTAMDTS